MASVASQLIEKVTAHAQSDSLEDVREICADGTCFPNNLRNMSAEYMNNIVTLLAHEMFTETITLHFFKNSTQQTGISLCFTQLQHDVLPCHSTVLLQ